MAEQYQEWTRLKIDFENLVNDVCSNVDFNFKNVYSLIESFHKKFSSLPIEGKLYVQVNKRLLSGQLIEYIKDIEYQKIKDIENSDCECQILSRFNKKPEIENLTQIGIINDQYYMPKLFRCNNCAFKWTSRISDDSTGNIVYEKHNSEDENFVEYHE